MIFIPFGALLYIGSADRNGSPPLSNSPPKGGKPERGGKPFTLYLDVAPLHRLTGATVNKCEHITRTTSAQVR